ncbi:hypothetical protein Sjap_008769 [Stephania japonica]|uniref:Uncharacterized protein n=1 Tax=Stephania japonica TaxID=461633 RepID=A0AAP0PEY9_9MAGN
MLRDEAWRRYLQDRESEDFRVLGLGKRRENRNTEVEGPGWTLEARWWFRVICDYPRKIGSGARRREATRATPEQSVDDEAVYLNVAGECSKGRVYGLGSVGRKKRRYGTPGASTSQTPGCGAAGEFDVVAEQLRKVMNFMHRHLGMDMDEIGLAQATTTTTATNTATS